MGPELFEGVYGVQGLKFGMFCGSEVSRANFVASHLARTNPHCRVGI